MKYVYVITRNGVVLHVCETDLLALSWCKIYENKYPDADFIVLKRSVWTKEDFDCLDINKF